MKRLLLALALVLLLSACTDGGKNEEVAYIRRMRLRR